MHQVDLRIDEQIRAGEALQSEHVRHVDVGRVAAVKRAFGVTAIGLVDHVRQRSRHKVVCGVGPVLRGFAVDAGVVCHGECRQSEAAVSADMPVVQMQDIGVARVRSLVQPDLDGHETQLELSDHHSLAQAFRLFSEDLADLVARGGIGDEKAVEHVVSHGVQRYDLPLVVWLTQVAPARWKLHVEHDLDGAFGIRGAVGHQIGEGQALGVARLGALFGERGGHVVGASEDGLPPIRVRRPLNALLQRRDVGCREE